MRLMAKSKPTPEQEEAIRNQQLMAAYIDMAQKDFLFFAKGLTLKSGYGPQAFSACVAPFQLKVLEDLAPSIQAERDGNMPPIKRAWMERTKKASKDTDIATILTWMTAFATRPMFLQVGAADRDQAGIVKRRIEDLLFYNKWLEDFIQIKSYEISGKLATLQIVAADVAGSHGETPDVLVINELSHVTKWEFVQNLLDNAAGVPQGFIIVATNAGIKGTKAHKLRENAKESANWYFHKFDEPAPWLSKEDLEEAKQSNSPSRFRRLFYGQWSSGKGDALDEDDIAKCFKKELVRLWAPEPEWQYIAGLDLGVTHDHSGSIVVGVHAGRQRIRVVQSTAWEPSIIVNGKKEVDLQAVEDWCFQMWRTFGITYYGYDPSQAKLMAQRLTRRGVPMREMTFSSAANLTQMAVGLVQVVEGGILESYEDDRLLRDFGKFNIVETLMGGRVDKDTGEKAASYKLQSVSDEFGHADLGTALVILLPKAISILEVPMFMSTDIVATPDDDSMDMTEEELLMMDPELREIYDAYDFM